MSSNPGVKAELAAAVRRMADIIERQSRQLETQQEIIEELHAQLHLADLAETRPTGSRALPAAARSWTPTKYCNPPDGICLVTYSDGDIGLLRAIRGSFGDNRDVVVYAVVEPYEPEEK